MKTVENRNALRAAITMEHYPILERLLSHEIRYQNSTWSTTGCSKVDSESLIAGFRRKRTRGAVPIPKARDEFTGRRATSREHALPSIVEEKRLHLVKKLWGRRCCSLS